MPHAGYRRSHPIAARMGQSAQPAGGLQAGALSLQCLKSSVIAASPLVTWDIQNRS